MKNSYLRGACCNGNRTDYFANRIGWIAPDSFWEFHRFDVPSGHEPDHERWWHRSYLIGTSRMQKSTRLLLHHSVPGNPRGGGWRDGGCGGRFSNNYIGLRWWWVAMATAVPSASYDWRQPSNRAAQPGSLAADFGIRARANDNGFRGHRRTARSHPVTGWNWINNHGLVIRECTFCAFFASASWLM